MKFFKIVGRIGISLGIVVGAIGILLFPVISQDYEADKTYSFTSNNKTYQTRRFSFGTVGSIDTRYTFETFRQYKYLPFEEKIDKTDFFDTKTPLDIAEDKLEIAVKAYNNKQKITFKDKEGNVFSKMLD